MIGRWWDGWVWMMVVLGFGLVHNGEREGEEKRQKSERGERRYWIIYFIV